MLKCTVALVTDRTIIYLPIAELKRWMGRKEYHTEKIIPDGD